jgi:hypothetical protein
MKPLAFLAALAAALQLFTSSALGSGDWTWPVRGKVITPYRNGSDPYAAGQHRGIDIAADVGDRVVAATAGTVTFAGVAGSSGLTVSIRTADGRFDTSYLHLSSTAVRAGESVAAGQRVGAVGTSGQRSAEQPHLHFGVREAGQRHAYRDPLDFLTPPPADPRPSPAPRPAPVPVADHAPIPLPAAVVAAPAASRAPAPGVGPRALRSRLPAAPPRAASRPHTGRVPAPAAARPYGDLAAASSGTGHPAVARSDAADARPGAGGAARPGAARHPTRSPTRHVELGGAPRTAPAGRGDGPRQPAVRPAVRAEHHGGGLDSGWLIACMGLVAAACALGRPDGASASARRAREAFGSLLRAGGAAGRQ